jgi:hypothetical protein
VCYLRISRYKTGKHFAVTITDTTLAVRRRADQIDAETALDGFYVPRTPPVTEQIRGVLKLKPDIQARHDSDRTLQQHKSLVRTG